MLTFVLAIAVGVVLGYAGSVSAKTQDDTYDLVCKDSLRGYHKFYNVPYEWRHLISPTGYIALPGTQRRVYFIRDASNCILMRRPYFEN